MRQSDARLVNANAPLLNRLQPLLISIAVICACFLAYLHAFDASKTLLGWDIDGAFLNAPLALHRALGGWDFYEALGANNAPFSARIPTYAVEALLELARVSPSMTQWLVTGFYLLLPPISMLAYTRVVFSSKPAVQLIASLAIFFNLYVAVSNHSNPYLFLNAAIASGPLIAACIIALIRKRSLSAVATLVACGVAVSIIGQNFATAAVALAMIIFLTLVGCKLTGASIKNAAWPLVGYFLLNAFWVLPNLWHFFADGGELAKSQYVVLWGDSTLYAVSEAANLYNWSRMVGTWDWTHLDPRGHWYTSFTPLYDHNLLWSALSYVPLTLAAVGAFRRRKVAAAFIVVFLLSFFLMKGSASPGGAWFMFLYHHLPGFKVFRDPYTKFGIPAIQCQAILAGLGADALISALPGRSRVIALCACALVTIGAIEPYWTGQMFKRGVYMQNYYVDVPESYHALADYLNSQPDQTGRALVFPFSPNLSYTALSWNFVGPDPLQFLVNRPTVFEDNGFADPFVHVVFADVNKSPETLERAAARASIQYIIVHHDVVRNVYGADSPDAVARELRSVHAIKVRSFGSELTLYEMPLRKIQEGALAFARHVTSVRGYPSRLSYVLSEHRVVSGDSKRGYSTRSALPYVAALPGTLGLELGPRSEVIPVVPPPTVTPASAATTIRTAIFMAQQMISSQIVGDIDPGTAEISPLKIHSAKRVTWQNVDHYRGKPSGAVYRSAPVDILPGDHVYALIYRASSTLGVGVSIRCCFPAHDAALGPDAYPPLDGNLRAVAFRVNYPAHITASLCVFGDASDVLTNGEAYLITATPVTTLQVQFPMILSLSPASGTFGSSLGVRPISGHVDPSVLPELLRNLSKRAYPLTMRSGDASLAQGFGGRGLAAGALPLGISQYSDQIVTDVHGKGTLILLQALNDGWVARINNRPLQKVIVDGVFNGWSIGGPGRVTVEFWPRRLLWFGTALSALAILLLFASYAARFDLRKNS